jgi:hypothetical protein
LNGGFSFYGLSREQRVVFQKNLMRIMVELEDSFFDLAKQCGKNAVVLCDRGAMDAKAYMDEEDWNLMLKQYNWTDESLKVLYFYYHYHYCVCRVVTDRFFLDLCRQARYDCVIHLVTAADGALKFYTNKVDIVAFL